MESGGGEISDGVLFAPASVPSGAEARVFTGPSTAGRPEAEALGYQPRPFKAGPVRRSLVECFGDDGVLEERLEGDDFEGVLVGGLQDDGAGSAGLLYLEPARGADAPPVAGL